MHASVDILGQESSFDSPNDTARVWSLIGNRFALFLLMGNPSIRVQQNSKPKINYRSLLMICYFPPPTEALSVSLHLRLLILAQNSFFLWNIFPSKLIEIVSETQ